MIYNALHFLSRLDFTTYITVQINLHWLIKLIPDLENKIDCPLGCRRQKLRGNWFSNRNNQLSCFIRGWIYLQIFQLVNLAHNTFKISSPNTLLGMQWLTKRIKYNHSEIIFLSFHFCSSFMVLQRIYAICTIFARF